MACRRSGVQFSLAPRTNPVPPRGRDFSFLRACVAAPRPCPGVRVSASAPAPGLARPRPGPRPLRRCRAGSRLHAPRAGLHTGRRPAPHLRGGPDRGSRGRASGAGTDRPCGGRRRSRTGTEASLTVKRPPWQNQTAGRDRGPAGGSSDACLHPRGGRRPPRNDAGTRHHHASRPPLARLIACGSSPRGRRRDLVRVHGLRPQLELIDGCPQAEVRLVRQRHADRA